MTEKINDKVKIMLPRLRGEGAGDVFVSVNCRNYLIKRGEEVSLPRAAAEVLWHSEQSSELADRYISESIGKGNQL